MSLALPNVHHNPQKWFWNYRFSLCLKAEHSCEAFHKLNWQSGVKWRSSYHFVKAKWWEANFQIVRKTCSPFSFAYKELQSWVWVRLSSPRFSDTILFLLPFFTCHRFAFLSPKMCPAPSESLHSFVHAFFQQIIKFLLCARHSSRHWGLNSERNRQNFCL